MIEVVNIARWQWLDARNHDLMSECEWQLKRMIKMTDDVSFKNKHYTDEFEIEFNNVYEEMVFQSYFKDLGYKLEMKSIGTVGKKYKIKIGI